MEPQSNTIPTVAPTPPTPIEPTSQPVSPPLNAKANKKSLFLIVGIIILVLILVLLSVLLLIRNNTSVVPTTQNTGVDNQTPTVPTTVVPTDISEPASSAAEEGLQPETVEPTTDITPPQGTVTNP